MTKQDTQILLYEKPRQMSLDRVVSMPMTALLVAGIVNPFGPTLTTVIVAGTLKSEVKLPVIRLMLNPFSQEVDAVGEITYSQKWQPSTVIPTLFELSFGACPTLLLPSKHLENDLSASLHAEFLRRFADARSVLKRVQQYFGNPWDRVSDEMREATSRILERTDVKGAETAIDPLDKEESSIFARLLLSEQHMKIELQAFFYAWNGSIQHIAPGLSSMSFKTFTGIFAHLANSCRLPDLSD